MPVKPIPDGYHTVTPYLIVDDAAAAIEFYRKAFGAEETMRMEHNGKVAHAEIRIGDSPIMLADEMPEMGYRSARSYGGTPVSLMLYVKDVDAVFERALAAGAESAKPVEDQFYGDRTGTVNDPFGHQWTIATHVREVSAEEMDQKFREMAAAMGGG